MKDNYYVLNGVAVACPKRMAGELYSAFLIFMGLISENADDEDARNMSGLDNLDTDFDFLV